jgi:hypothetical protein
MVRDKNSAARTVDAAITEAVGRVSRGGRKSLSTNSGGDRVSIGGHNAHVPPAPVKMSKPEKIKIKLPA